MTAYKTRPCIKCDRVHGSKNDICNWCDYREKRDAARKKVGACLFCGGQKENHRLLISPYCYPCSSKVNAQSIAASVKVRKAVVAGVLLRLDGEIPCTDCGKPATLYEHRDYTKPLAVDPVCRRCNQRRGPAIKFTAKVGADKTASKAA